MRKRFPSIVRVLVVLAMVISLTAVFGVAPALAQNAVLNPTAGPVGTSVTVTVTGFAPSSILTAKFDGAAVTTAPTSVQTDTAGAATFALLVPSTTAGAHTVTVSDGVNTDTDTFTIQPKVAISPTTGSVGTTATVTGTGFAAGVTADVFFTLNNADPLDDVFFAAGVLVDIDGSFSATGTIPSLGSGGQTVSAADGAGNAAAVTATFNVKPKLTVSPASGLAGSTVSLTGTGWDAGHTVTFSFGGQAWTAATTTASSTGSISVTAATLPTALPGVKQISGTDGTNTAATTFTVAARPLTLTPNQGPMGITVLVTGSNMSPAPATIPQSALQIGGNPWNTGGSIALDSAGVIAPTSLVILAGLTAGVNTVVATDSNGLTATGAFTVTKPTVQISPATGPKGSSSTITGAGWVPNSSVTLNFAGAMMSVFADPNGNIAAAMMVPATAATGANSITAADALGNSATPATFTVPGATISVSPTEGPQGSEVTVTGSGFAGYSGMTIKIGNYEFPTKPLTNPLGAFTFSAMVPGVAPGSQVLSANDGASTATTFFVVKAAPVTVATSLAGITGKLTRVWGYYDGEWQMYDPADPVGSDLENLTAGRGYWINVTEDVTLIYGGYSYDLNAGWNNIGWR